MIEKKYIECKLCGIDNKPKWIIVDDNGNIINKNPSKEELKKLKTFPIEKYKKRYIKTRLETCTNINDNGDICKDKLTSKNTLQERGESYS